MLSSLACLQWALVGCPKVGDYCAGRCSANRDELQMGSSGMELNGRQAQSQLWFFVTTRPDNQVLFVFLYHKCCNIGSEFFYLQIPIYTYAKKKCAQEK